MADLIPMPVLDPSNDEQLAAKLIGRVTGPLTTDLIDQYVASFLALRDQVESGLLPAQPICPELSNANPSSPHTAELEAFAWVLGQQFYLFNQIPLQNEIAFANLFGIDLRQPSAATTTLQFDVAPPLNTNVTIPAGTQVQLPNAIADANGPVVFATDADLIIPFGQGSGTVTATRTVAGHTLLAPNQLTSLLSQPAWVESVTNPSGIDSGTDLEDVQSALQRARQYQVRAERLVSTSDIENAVLTDVLLGNGIVKGFPFVSAGNWATQVAGYTTLVVAGADGSPVDAAKKQAINNLLATLIGNQFVSVVDPIYVQFTVSVTVALKSSANAIGVQAAIKAALALSYAPSEGNFGRPVLRAEIIALIEGVPGVLRIVSQVDGPILGSPVDDVVIAPWELPQLTGVNITIQ